MRVRLLAVKSAERSVAVMCREWGGLVKAAIEWVWRSSVVRTRGPLALSWMRRVEAEGPGVGV